MKDFLPICRADMEKRGWEQCDFVYVIGDAYQQAMEQVLELAVELPVYQRDVLYAYNANVINSDTLSKDVNPYSTPLDRIWELEFAG